MFLKIKLSFVSFIVLNLFCIHWAIAAKPKEKTDEALQSEVLIYINKYRQQHGLSKLKMDNYIVIQAKKHSQDMASHRMPFGHTDFNKRIAQLRSQIKNVSSGAENVAYNYKNAQEVVKQWVLSPGHKRNIKGHYNLTGIGVARDTHGKLYFTQIFILTQESHTRLAHESKRSYIRISPFFSLRKTS